MADKKIMIVEDDALIAAGLRDVFTGLGYDVPAAVASGEEAVRVAAETRPDLLLMDILLSGELDGIEAAEQIRAWLDVPVVYLTAHVDDALLQRAKITEPYSYLVKPIRKEELLATVEMALYKHEIEKRLKESERWLDATLRSIGDAVIATDKEGRVRFMNPVAEALTGWKQEEALGEDLTEVFHIVNEETRVLTENPVAKVVREGVVVGLANHTLLIARDGTETPVDDSAAPIRDEKGQVTGIVLVFRDITQRRQAEEALRESHRHLEETLAELRATQEKVIQQERMAAVGQLAVGIAHDFNNILASIVLYAQMSLHLSELAPKIRERLEAIAQRAQRGADLVQQILDFGRRAVLRRQALDLSFLLEEMIGLLRRTLPEKIRIELVQGGSEYRIDADPARVQQTIVNLALNARDAMPDGGELRIRLERVRIKEGQEVPLPEMLAGEWVRVAVTDTGTGIPSDVLPHIFEPFFTTRAPLGHGLGLAQVYGIVKQHEGHIDVETEVGRGTTFTLYWPALPAHPPEAVELELAALAMGSGETVLVVEDDDAMRKALADVLEMLNYQVLEARDGREALAVFEQHQGDPLTGSGQEISLVLSDWKMPLMSGLELVRELRKRHSSVKVVILTGYPLDRGIETTALEGVVGWVRKPPDLEQLAQTLARALRERE